MNSESSAQIRPYRPDDEDACRGLWTELVEHHREIYQAPGIGGDQPELEFDAYLERPDRVSTWVAVLADKTVVGMSGLLWDDGEAEIEPVIVSRTCRGEGVGRMLIMEAIEESRRRGAIDVNIRPVARNESAVRAFHQLGFRTLGHVQMFMRLDGSETSWRPGIEIHGRKFDH